MVGKFLVGATVLVTLALAGLAHRYRSAAQSGELSDSRDQFTIRHTNRPRSAKPSIDVPINDMSQYQPGKSDAIDEPPPLKSEGRLRSGSLADVHANQVQKFIDSNGFGLARLLRRPYHYYKPSWEQPDRIVANRGAEALPPGREAPAESEPPIVPFAQFREELNRFSLRDLAYSASNRGSEIDEVAGVGSYAFSHQSKLDFQSPELAPAAIDRWRTKHFNLIGRLNRDEPVVYMTSGRTEMELYKSAPVRPLDAFETQALAKLRQGESLVIEAGADRIRMLGRLLAGKRCSECHHVERGELLGAFTYEFLRTPHGESEPGVPDSPQPEQ